MSTARLRRVALGACLLIGAFCTVSVFVVVVITGGDGARTNVLAVLAVAALVASWRLRRHQPDETVTD